MEFDALIQSNEELELTPETETTKFLSDSVTALLVVQIGHEMFAFYEYTATAVWFENQGLCGFAAWARKQACDEQGHMQKVLGYLVEVGIELTLPAISEAPAMATDVKGAVLSILTREKSVTKNWQDIARQCMQDVDVATLQLAQCFMLEQQEEENLVKIIMQRVDLCDTTTGILVLDGQLKEQYGE